jgi:pyrimidine deaminase RibD-like protein
MPVDSETAKYAHERFNQRLEEEIRPAYRERLSEATARWNPRPQLLFSGSQAKAFIGVEARYARETAYAQAESLIEALEKAGAPFDDDAFRKALDDTKKLLEKHGEYSYRKVIGHFNRAAIPPDALKGVEQTVDNEMAHIHDSVLRFLKLKLQETVLTARKARQPATPDDEDRQFAKLAIEEARQSVSEQDGKPHPMVGAVIVKDGKVLSSAHRGEAPGNHAEFTALDKKLADEAVYGATVYTTLEPCTTRNHPKIPCVKRIIDRKVARVVVGMLDPDPRITGRGMLALRNANIAIDLFPTDLMTEIEELNREFKRLHEQQSQPQPQAQQSASSPRDDIRAELGRFAERKMQIRIEPMTPASEYPIFQVHELDDKRVIVKKLSSSQTVGIPVSRVTEILWGDVSEPPTLMLNGRLQWITIPNEWKFFPETPPSSDEAHLGHARSIGSLQDPYATNIGVQLQQRSYKAHWFRKENLPVCGGASDGRGWQLFYGEDGRYLVCLNNHEVLILAVQWDFSG